MSDEVAPNPDDAAARLEAALERIAAAARPVPGAPPPGEYRAAVQQQAVAGAELDGLIARLRAGLREFGEPAAAPGLGDPAAIDPEEV